MSHVLGAPLHDIASQVREQFSHQKTYLEKFWIKRQRVTRLLPLWLLLTIVTASISQVRLGYMVMPSAFKFLMACIS